MREVGVLGGEQVGERRGAAGGFLLQRAFEDEAAAKGVEAYLAPVALLVAVARRDVHHRREPSAILGSEAAGVDVGIVYDVGLENGVQAYGMEGVVDNHAVEQAEVLYHAAAADV